MSKGNFDYLPPDYRNPLTDLPNRLAVKESLERAINENSGQFALLELDIDGLKEINDTLGHLEGDEFLRTAGAVLGEILRQSDLYLPAHKSGDEFSVILHNVTSEAQVAVIKERIRHTLAEYGVETSIGGRLHIHGETAEELSHAADALMYEDKVKRKIEKYNTPEIRRSVREMARIALENDISPRDLPTLMTLMQEGLF